jgi:hypothetical protein
MKVRRWRGGRFAQQYSEEYHLSRAVACQDCGARLHKDHDFVLHGNRCSLCWGRFCREQRAEVG